MNRLILLTLLLLAAPLAAAAELILFEHDNFQGRQMVLNGTVPDLANSGFNDITSSIIVRSGTWQVCENAYFQGRCKTLAPGQYRSMNRFGLNDMISSVRDMNERAYRPPPPQAGYVPPPPPRRGGNASAQLFEGGNLQGRSFVLEDAARDLSDTGFNQPASSMRIERGTFQFCSEVDFRGRCSTFGPGEYRSLPFRIASGRRIDR